MKKKVKLILGKRAIEEIVRRKKEQVRTEY
jgi:hypothetical protein